MRSQAELSVRGIEQINRTEISKSILKRTNETQT